MPAAGGGNTRAKQLKKPKKRGLVPHGPGGQRLRPAPKASPTPRTPAAKRRGIKVVQRAASTAPAPTRNYGTGNTRAKQVEKLIHKTRTGTPHEVRQAYRALPLEERRKLVHKIASKYGLLSDAHHGALARLAEPTKQDHSVLVVHDQRAKHDAEAMASPFANKRQSELIDSFKGSKTYLDALEEAHKSGIEHAPKPKHRASDVYETDPNKLRKLGFKEAGTVDKLMAAPLGALASGAAVAEATYHDPVGVPVKTAKQALDAIPALPGQAVDLVTHPVKTVKEQAKAFGERSTEKYDERVKTIRKRGGLDYGADAALVLAPGSAAARGLKLGERAAIRTTGGTAKSRATSGLIRDTAGRTLDNARARKHERRLAEAEAGGTPVDALEQQAAEANRKAGRVVEVVGRRAPQRQAKIVAKQRGHALYAFKRDQGQRVAAASKAINTLSKKEKRAFYYASTLGIRNAEQALELLPKLREKILATREAEGVKVKSTLKKSDMLPDIEAILKAPEAHFTPKLGEVVESLRADSLRASHEDPSLTEGIARERRFKPLAEALDLHHGEGAGPYFDETDAEFIDRVADKALAPRDAGGHGLAEPLYFKSERYVGPTDYGSRTVGGLRATANDPRDKGVNRGQGLQDTSPDQYLRGLARNIKRKHNWSLVADILDKNGIKEFSQGEVSTISQLRERLARKGVDMNSIAFWNPGVYRRNAQDFAESPVDERHVAGEEFEQANISAALDHSVVRRTETGQWVDGTGQVVDGEQLAKSSGWQVVPDGVLKELEAQMVPSGRLARSWDIAKGKASRAMLLTGNIPWLGFQVVSNAGMGAAATGGRILNPINWHHAMKDWRAMSHEEQQRVGAILGLDATSADTRQVKLGAASNGNFVNAYRLMKAHPIWHTGLARGRGPSVSELNPLELMARADRGQNNIFRIVAGYSLAKRDAVRRMGEEMGHAEKAQAKLMGIFQMPPREQLRVLREDPTLLERHGEAVADWMGDYSTMTAAERKVINRAVMFMPYIRYSLKLLFYTLPVKHPAVTAVLAEMGNMKAEELRKLLGEDSLPFNIGKIYFGHGGDVKSIDLRRANPALNSVIDAARNKSLSQAIGIMPPYVAWLTDQAYGKSSFTGKDFAVQGRAAQYGQRLPLGALDVRARILANDALSLMYPARAAGHLEYNPTKDGPIPILDGGRDERLAGPQGADSTIFAPRPTHFKGNTTVSKLQKKFGERRQKFEDSTESLIHELIPLLPNDDRSRAESREQKILTKAEAPKKKGRKKKSSGYKFGGRSKGYKFGG